MKSLMAGAKEKAKVAKDKAIEKKEKIQGKSKTPANQPREWSGFSEKDKIKQTISEKVNQGRKFGSSSLSETPGFNKHLFEQNKQNLKESRSRLEDIAKETQKTYKCTVTLGQTSKDWSELVVDFGKKQPGVIGRGIEEMAVVLKTLENAHQATMMDALESLQHGMRSLLDNEYKEVSALKRRFYDVDKQMQAKTALVEKITSQDAVKNAPKIAQARPELEALEYQHAVMGDQLFFAMQAFEDKTHHTMAEKMSFILAQQYAHAKFVAEVIESQVPEIIARIELNGGKPVPPSEDVSEQLANFQKESKLMQQPRRPPTQEQLERMARADADDDYDDSDDEARWEREAAEFEREVEEAAARCRAGPNEQDKVKVKTNLAASLGSNTPHTPEAAKKTQIDDSGQKQSDSTASRHSQVDVTASPASAAKAATAAADDSSEEESDEDDDGLDDDETDSDDDIPPPPPGPPPADDESKDSKATTKSKK